MKTKIILWLAIIVILAMVIYPPWLLVETYRHPDGYNIKLADDVGYSFIFSPHVRGMWFIENGKKIPIPRSMLKINFIRLSIQIIAVVVLFGGIWLIFIKSKKKYKKVD